MIYLRERSEYNEPLEIVPIRVIKLCIRWMGFIVEEKNVRFFECGQNLL